MWPFKKKKAKQKEYVVVKKELKKLTITSYIVKIYDVNDKLIGETDFADKYLYSDRWDNLCDKDSFPFNDYKDDSEYNKFQNFLSQKTLSFEDFEYDQVILSTDIIKKVVISVFESHEEEVQLYKMEEIK